MGWRAATAKVGVGGECGGDKKCEDNLECKNKKCAAKAAASCWQEK